MALERRECLTGYWTKPSKPRFPKTQGRRLKRPLGPWGELVHHRGYAGFFVKFLEPGKDPRLIDVSSTQAYGEEGISLLKGWECQQSLASDTRRSGRKGATGEMWGNPVLVALTIEPDYQTHVRVVNVTKGEPGDTDRSGTSFMGGKSR